MFSLDRDPDASLLIRTDFSDDAAWRALCDLVQQPNPDEGFQAFFVCVDDPRVAGMSIDAIARQAASDLNCAAIFIADTEAIDGKDHAILCVDCADTQERNFFRVIPLEVWGPENNLRIGNMDFAEFENASGPDGVFRGFRN
jgi:hypothetical protein